MESTDLINNIIVDSVLLISLWRLIDIEENQYFIRKNPIVHITLKAIGVVSTTIIVSKYITLL